MLDSSPHQTIRKPPVDIQVKREMETVRDQDFQDFPVVRKSLSTTQALSHTVQFYEDETCLYDAVVDLIAEGLMAGEPAVIIATESHCKAFSLRLQAKGFHLEDVCAKGQLTMLDAEETLSQFMVGSMPDSQRFKTTINDILGNSRLNGSRSIIRIYGEMVDVLLKEGNMAGATRLEELWNEIADTHTFTLLCAYAMDNFDTAAHTSCFDDICGRHTHVLPTERYTRGDEKTRLLEISMLQQRARALENEVRQRQALEQQLRASLAEQERLLKREQVARADAEAANRTKAAFLATMSHELRTPLNAIGGYTDLIEMGVRGPVTEEQLQDLSRIRHSQRHLLSLISDLLHYAKLEAGQVEYHTTVITLAHLFSRVEELTSHLFLSKSVACLFEETSLSVQADTDKLCQILVNLLSNAAKFTEAGGSVTVRAAREGGEHTHISVQDTGHGISAEYLSAIFDPFFQAGRPPHRAGEGVGLGLAISRDLARGMRGDLTVTSEVGVGSTFVLTLPSAM